MQIRYRSDYDGEFIIINTTFTSGQKEQQREWVANPIEMNLVSPRAVVIGAGYSREKFPIKRLEGHKGGLLGRQRLQSYGCKNSWKELQLDFYYSADKENLQQIVDSAYSEKVTVYASTKNCVRFPGEFFIVPYGATNSCDEAIAMYLAAFDEHTQVYCIGVDAVDENFTPHQKTISQISTVLKTYSATEFIFVNNAKNNVPSEWRWFNNVRVIDYDTFISECDI